MSVLVRDMEMPRCCGRCPCFHASSPMYCQADKTIKMTAPYGMRMEGCPLKEVEEEPRESVWKILAETWKKNKHDQL